MTRQAIGQRQTAAERQLKNILCGDIYVREKTVIEQATTKPKIRKGNESIEKAIKYVAENPDAITSDIMDNGFSYQIAKLSVNKIRELAGVPQRGRGIRICLEDWKGLETKLDKYIQEKPAASEKEITKAGLLGAWLRKNRASENQPALTEEPINKEHIVDIVEAGKQPTYQAPVADGESLDIQQPETDEKLEMPADAGGLSSDMSVYENPDRGNGTKANTQERKIRKSRAGKAIRWEKTSDGLVGYERFRINLPDYQVMCAGKADRWFYSQGEVEGYIGKLMSKGFSPKDISVYKKQDLTFRTQIKIE